MENDTVVVAVLDVSGEVFTSFRSEFRIELELDCSLVRFEFYAGFAHRGVVLELGKVRGKEKRGPRGKERRRDRETE